MIFYDKYGFPVERFKDRPVVNFIRLLIWTNIRKTFQRFGQPIPTDKPDPGVKSFREPVVSMGVEEKPWMKFKGTLPVREGTPEPSKPAEWMEYPGTLANYVMKGETMKPTAEKLDALVNAIKGNMTAYYCKWCKRHLPREPDADVFVHDDVFHPANYSPECGGEHRVH